MKFYLFKNKVIFFIKKKLICKFFFKKIDFCSEVHKKTKQKYFNRKKNST